jgi:sugar phosphate isomerase/epimerase
LDAHPIVIAIENLTAKEGDWAVKQLDYPFGWHNKLYLGICLDTLHEYSTGCDALKDFTDIIDGCGNFLVEVHLNNGPGKNRINEEVPHKSLIEGSVPVKEIIRHLLARGFILPVVVEVDSGKELDTSIELIRRTQASFLIWQILSKDMRKFNTR